MTDFLAGDDLEIISGDFAVGFSDLQHQKHILIAEKAEYKQTPEIGVGIRQILNSEDAAEFLIEAKKNFEYDGMDVKDISFTDDFNIKVDANYK